jgi:hypothetical protein
LTVSIQAGRVAGVAIAHAGDLVVAAAEEAALVPGILEGVGVDLLDGLGLPVQPLGHGIGELLADDGLEAGACTITSSSFSSSTSKGRMWGSMLGMVTCQSRS